MMVNEFAYRNYNCPRNDAGVCNCMYETDLAPQCLIRGTGVLSNYGYQVGETGKWVGIMISIIFAYRLFGWLVLYIRKQ